MKITATFTSNDGTVTTATFDGESKTVVDQNGRKGTYSRAEGTNTLEIEGDMKLAITGKDPLQFVPGFTTTYTSSTGGAGTVTIVSVG